MKSKTGLLFLMADVDPAISGYFKLMNPNRYELFTSRYLNDISRHHKISMFSTRVLMSSITWRFSQKEKLHFSLVCKTEM